MRTASISDRSTSYTTGTGGGLKRTSSYLEAINLMECAVCPSIWNGPLRKCILIIAMVCMVAIMPIGYSMVILNVPEKVIQAALNDSLDRSFNMRLSQQSMGIFWAMIVASQSLGALIGCLLVIVVRHNFGTKTAMLLVNAGFLLVGSVVMALPAIIDFAPLMVVGRTIIGIYTGLAIILVPLFLHEVAPKEIKGALGCFIHIAVCIGGGLGASLSLEFILGGANTWGILLLLPAVFAVAQLALNWWLPETPNSFLNQEKYVEAAQSVRWYHRIREENDEKLLEKYSQLCTAVPNQMGIAESFSFPDIRWGIFLGMVVSATQVFSGSMATISYSTSMFSSVSFVTFLIPFMPALGSLLSAILTLPAMRLVEAMGRRDLLLSTLLICVVADFLFILFSLQSADAKTGSWSSYAFAITFFVYGLGYNLGTGPVAYFIPGELVPPKAASVSLGAAVAVNWISTLITTLVYYPLNLSVGGWSYLLFALPTLCMLIFLYFHLPETKYLYQERKTHKPSIVRPRLPEDYGTIPNRHALYPA